MTNVKHITVSNESEATKIVMHSVVNSGRILSTDTDGRVMTVCMGFDGDVVATITW